MIKFTTQHCGFCWVAKCIVTGCNPNRAAGVDAVCSKCGSLLPPRGTITKLKYMQVIDPEDKGSVVATGYLAKVRRDEDQEHEWYLVHCRGGAGSLLFSLLGSSSKKLKDWLKTENLRAMWPSDTLMGTNSIVPFA